MPWRSVPTLRENESAAGGDGCRSADSGRPWEAIVSGGRSCGGVVGRASRRKKIRRQAARGSRRAGQVSGADAENQEALLKVIAGLEAMSEEFRRHKERYEAACRVWCDGDEPVPASAPEWPEDSLGDRLFANSHMEEARGAPSLLTAKVPDHAMISANSAHWAVATNALVRAVAFDGLRPDHLVVSTLLDLLGPIAEAELAYGTAMEAWLDRYGPTWREQEPRERGPREPEPREPEPEFPEEDGPVSLLGAFALVDATWAVVGLDPVGEVHALLARVLDGTAPGLEGRAVADALIGAFARHYQCEGPGDAELLDRIGHEVSGNPLEVLVAAKAVPPRDVLRAGLAVLSVLTELCRSGSASILHSAA